MGGHKLPGAVIGLVLSLVPAGCDLLNSKPEIDVERAIDEAVAYANAAPLTVEVYYPETWGRSPQFGLLSAGSARLGFPFTVEFTVSDAYGFTGWRAYRTADLGNRDQAALDGASPLSAGEAAVSGGADGRASVTVTITEPVTLIPWCEDRPRITQTNPPLVINPGISYTRGQQIKIWFAGPLDPSTVQFGGGFIEISGRTTGESSELYDAPETGVNENGDLTGQAAGAMRFFKAPVYDESARIITISPEEAGALTALPPGDSVITVTVGGNVLSPNGNGMTGAVSFYYRTNMLEVKNVYTAENIWAVHQPLVSPAAEQFFYTGADTNRDRRLRKNASGKYEVTLYFTAGASNPAEMTDSPDKFKIAELRYANLAGGSAISLNGERDCTAEAVESGGGTAGEIYRRNNSGTTTYHKIRYEWASEPLPGIIRLIVLPYRDQDGDGDFTDPGDIAPDDWGNAQAEGHFAAVVLDNQPPSGSAGVDAAGSAGRTPSLGGLTQYNYGRTNKFLSFTVNFSAVADNGGNGIELNRASMDTPWTMDNAADLAWQYQITDSAGTAYPPGLDAEGALWRALDANPAQNAVTDLDLSAAIGSNTALRDLSLRYRDTLGNVSAWFPAARIYYYEDNLAAVSVWDAAYNPDSNTITVGWTNPPPGKDFIRAEAFYTVEGGGGAALTVTGAAAAPGGAAGAVLTGVPRQDDSGVRNGTPVSGGRRYDITIRVHSDTNQMDTVFTIWNFGTPGAAGSGMRVSSAYPAETISTQVELAAMKLNDVNKKYVLVNDITLTGGAWTPIGTVSNTFRGKFYGSGHTIRGLKPAAIVYMGLFGSINGAEIRDLKVVVDHETAPSGTVQALGGIAGNAALSALRNLIVEVPAGRVLGFTSTNTDLKVAGGIAGLLTDTTIDNCRVEGDGTLAAVSGSGYGALYAGGAAGFLSYGSSGIRDCSVSLAVKAEGTAGLTGLVYGGGIVASLETSGSSLDYAVSRCLMSGELSVAAAGNVQLYAGGAVGRCTNPALIDHITVSGTITMNKGAFSQNNYCGGIIGYNEATSIEDCEFSGRIIIPETFAASGNTDIGGIAGQCIAGSGVSPRIRDSAASGDLNIRSSGLGQIRIGGVFGYVAGLSSAVKVEVENCRYERGDIAAERFGSIMGSSLFVGGFAGYLSTFSALSGCRSLAGSVSAHGFVLAAGGFVGVLDTADLDGCYAVTDVFSTGISAQYTGGLAGQTYAGSTISRCYATGSVQAVSTGSTSSFHTGGLVGSVINTHISDSYALGSVLADYTFTSITVPICAGGITGYSSYGTIEHCFNAGTVTAQSAAVTGTLYAGGILGQGSNTKLQNNAALGVSVTAQGSGTKTIGRVYGAVVGGGGTTGNNRAVNTMLLFSDASYNIPYPGTVLPSAATAAGKDGLDAADNDLRGQTFWTGLGFDAGWDFSRVFSARHPALAGLGGQ